MREQAAEATIAAIANKVTYGGGGVALWGAYSASDLAAFGGLLIALVGLCIQIYYKRRADRRDAELHAAQMEDLRRG